jgi:hypothetical protein
MGLGLDPWFHPSVAIQRQGVKDMIEGDEVKAGQVIARVDQRDSVLHRDVLVARLKALEGSFQRRLILGRWKALANAFPKQSEMYSPHPLDWLKLGSQNRLHHRWTIKLRQIGAFYFEHDSR